MAGADRRRPGPPLGPANARQQPEVLHRPRHRPGRRQHTRRLRPVQAGAAPWPSSRLRPHERHRAGRHRLPAAGPGAVRPRQRRRRVHVSSRRRRPPRSAADRRAVRHDVRRRLQPDRRPPARGQRHRAEPAPQRDPGGATDRRRRRSTTRRPRRPATGITAAAYTNNDLDADTATTLFDLDTRLTRSRSRPRPTPARYPTGKLGVDAGARRLRHRGAATRPLPRFSVGGKYRLYASRCSPARSPEGQLPRLLQASDLASRSAS